MNSAQSLPTAEKGANRVARRRKIPQFRRQFRIYTQLKGSFVQFGYASDFGPGYGSSFMFMGCDPITTASLVGMPPSMVAMRIPQVCMSARAFARFHGMSATLLPGNIGGTFYLGALF